mgnify:FL=1
MASKLALPLLELEIKHVTHEIKNNTVQKNKQNKTWCTLSTVSTLQKCNLAHYINERLSKIRLKLLLLHSFTCTFFDYTSKSAIRQIDHYRLTCSIKFFWCYALQTKIYHGSMMYIILYIDITVERCNTWTCNNHG